MPRSVSVLGFFASSTNNLSPVSTCFGGRPPSARTAISPFFCPSAISCPARAPLAAQKKVEPGGFHVAHKPWYHKRHVLVGITSAAKRRTRADRGRQS